MEKKRARLLIAATAVMLALLLPPVIRADGTTFTLAQPSQAGVAGETLDFQGTITNSGAADVFLNGDSFSTATAFLIVDDSAFFTNTPASLAASGGSVGPVDLFSVQILASAIPGTYGSNFFNVLGGSDGSATDLLATQEFTITVTQPGGGGGGGAQVPEPGTLVLFGTGMLSLAALARKKLSV